jgi:DNA (cytosine-5)-methyltransferase 1
MMGNALVVNLIRQMEPLLDEIISEEPEIELNYNIAEGVEVDTLKV